MFCHRATAADQAAAGFGVEFDWDVSLLDGYSHRFLTNVARKPALSSFGGLDTPETSDIIKKENYDAVIVNGWHYKSAWQAMWACWRTGTPVMARSDSHLHTSRTAVKRAAKWPFYRWFISKLAACLPVGKWSRDYFLHYGASPERVFVVPHVVDTDYFSSESARLLDRRSKLREQWHLDDDSVVFLFVGKFVEKKRPVDFVQAIHKAAQQGARIDGLMVGDGPLRQSCEQYALNNDVPVRFVGFLNQSEIAKAYIASDALILASNGGETWGLVANEAMACGRPCFVSDRVGCGPDLVVPGETGEVFPLGDVSQIAGLIGRYSADPKDLRRMGQLARLKIQTEPTRRSTANVLRALAFVGANQ